MKLNRTIHAVVYSSDSNRSNRWRELLQEIGLTTESFAEFPGSTNGDSKAATQYFVVDCRTEGFEKGLGLCRTIKHRSTAQYLPVALIVDGSVELPSFPIHPDLPDVIISDSMSDAAIVSNFAALLRMLQRDENHLEATAALKREVRRFELTCEQIDGELELAGRIQRSFLPHALPNVPGLTFAVKSVPSAVVSGDIYDVAVLDPRTVSFFVADAMGHGVPAGLLTMYVKKAIQTKDPDSITHEALLPNEVMDRLNADMLAQDISENAFVTLTYLNLDLPTRELKFSRAGHPPAILIPRQGPLEKLTASGTMLGVFDRKYECGGRHLSIGDKVVVYSDGVDCVRYRDEQQGLPSFIRCLNDFRVLPIERMIDEIYRILFPDQIHEDDLTLLGVELT